MVVHPLAIGGGNAVAPTPPATLPLPFVMQRCLVDCSTEAIMQTADEYACISGREKREKKEKTTPVGSVRVEKRGKQQKKEEDKRRRRRESKTNHHSGKVPHAHAC